MRRSSGSGTRSAPTCRSWTANSRPTGQPRLTYFECLTILGFAVFADQPVNVAVIEVGLGGITDATNVGDGQVSVVTPISLDHTDLLGDTTGDIAYEKAGIIKPGGFLISAAQPVDAAQVLLEKAKEVNVPFRFEGVEFGVESRTVAVGGQMVTIQGIAGRYEDLLVPLHGAHQAENAAVAIAALEAFFGGEKAIDAEILQEAFASVTSPGRLEVVRTAPTIIVDAAHNPEGIRVSAEAIHEAFNFTKLVVVVGVLREKDAEEILRQLKESLGGLATEYCFTQSNSPRAVPAEDLAEIAVDLGFGEDNIHVAEKLDDALEWAVERAEADDEPRRRRPRDRFHHARRGRPDPARKGGRVSDGETHQSPARMAPGHAQETTLHEGHVCLHGPAAGSIRGALRDTGRLWAAPERIPCRP